MNELKGEVRIFSGAYSTHCEKCGEWFMVMYFDADPDDPPTPTLCKKCRD